MKVKAPFKVEVIRGNYKKERLFWWYFQCLRLSRYGGNEEIYAGSYTWNKFVREGCK